MTFFLKIVKHFSKPNPQPAQNTMKFNAIQEEHFMQKNLRFFALITTQRPF